MKILKVYEVWRNTPYGDTSMGLFLSKKSANKCMNEWNATVKSSWDKASISIRKVQL